MCHKQYTIYMLPQESWGKTPNVYRGVTITSRFFFLGGHARLDHLKKVGGPPLI